MNEISRKPAHTVTELASARQHQKKLAGHHRARGGGHGPDKALTICGHPKAAGLETNERVIRVINLSKSDVGRT